MFATQSKNKSESSAAAKPKRAEAATAGKDAPEQNPVWRSLALRTVAIQPKLAVSQPDDPDEHEADRTADRVMRMPEQKAQPKCEACATSSSTCPSCAGEKLTSAPEPQVRRACASCSTGGSHTHADEEEVPVRRKAERAAEQAEACDGLVGRLGAGRPLETGVRAFFEPRLERDLSDVRVHTGGAAADAATSLDAYAFTLGRHIAFGRGQYAPDSTPGRRLIAHELAHVMQSGAPMLHRSAVIVPAPNAPPPSGEGPLPNQGEVVPAVTPPRAAAVPKPETCPPPKDLACNPNHVSPKSVTNTLIFPQDSAALTPTQVKEIDAAAASWHTAGGTMTVRVDGYASAEGPCEYNWRLSCKRAQAVAADLSHPSDHSPGVPSTSVEVFAHGESDEAGRALAPNRKATISLPVPPPPPPPPTPPVCVLPVSLGPGRTGCGSGTDFTHFDFPTISTTSAAKLSAWALTHAALSRGGVSNADCESEMDSVLSLTGGGAGHAAFARFVAGTGGTVTLGTGSTLGALALTSPSFLTTVTRVKRAIEAQLATQAASGALDPCALSLSPLPQTHFRLGGPDDPALQAVIGGTHGEKLFADAFTGSAAARTYTITLHFLICDNFGVDEHDLYFFGLFPFWVLQHERSATKYTPFINELDLTVTLSGTF